MGHQFDRSQFLLAFHGNCGSVLYRLQDIASYWSKIANFLYPTLFSAPAWGDLVGIWRICSILVKLHHDSCLKTRSSAVAKRPRDALCLYSFNTKYRAQSFIISCFGFRYPLRTIKFFSVLFSSAYLSMLQAAAWTNTLKRREQKRI